MPLPRRIAERYRVVARAGAGGFGEVLRAVDEVTGREVALKLFLPGKSLRTGDAAAEEFRLLSSIRHPHLAAALDLGTDGPGGRPYLVSEWAAGRDLDREKALESDAGALACVAAQILEALGALNRHGFVHLDVKPANVRVALEPGPVCAVLLDFGLARRAATLPDDAAARPVGSPPYAAPEVASGAPVDGRADLYGLGVSLLRVLAGSPAALEARLSAAGTDAVAAGLPEPFGRFLPHLLARDPAARPKDAATALEVLCSLAPAAVAGGLPSARAPFVGREGEASRLLAAIAATKEPAEKAPAVAILVVGEEGSGRSRLLDEVRVRLRSAAGETILPILVSAEDTGGGPGAFLARLVRSLLAADGRPRTAADPATLPLLAIAGRLPRGARAPEAASPLVLGAALARLVAAAAAARPVALLLDEPERADRLSRDAVRAYLRLEFSEPDVGGLEPTPRRERRAAVVVAESPGALAVFDSAPPLRRKEIRVSPLDRDAIRALVAFEAPGLDAGVAARLAAEIAAKSGGHAGLAAELARAAGDAARRPEEVATLSIERLALPSRLPDLAARRLDAIEDPTRSLLFDLAVLGRAAPAAILAALGHGAAALSGAARLGLLREDDAGAVSPASEILREAALARLGADDRLRRHAAVARALEAAGGDPAEIARHALAAGRDDSPRLALAAAEVLAGRNAPAAAARLLLDALSRSTLDPAARAEKLARAGVLLLRAGEPAEALPAFRDALRLEAALDSARIGLAEAERRLGSPGAALATLERARPSPESAAAIASIEIERGAPDAAAARIRSVLGAESDAGPARATEARLRNLLGIASARLFRPEAAVEEFEAARALAAEAKDDETLAGTLTNLGVLYYQEGRLDLALERHRASLALARRRADVVREAAALNNLSLVLRDRGSLRAAADALLESFRLREKIGDAHGAGSSLANLAAVERERGRLARAIALGTRALERLGPPLDAPRERSLAAFHLGLARLAAGDCEGAIAAAVEAERSAAAPGPDGSLAPEAAAARVLLSRARILSGERDERVVSGALAVAKDLASSRAPRALKIECDAGLAEALVATGRAALAEEPARRAADAARDALPDAATRALLTLVEARADESPAERLATLRSLSRAARSSERQSLVFRVDALLADAEAGAGRRAEAERAARRAREAVRAVEDALPGKALEPFRSSPLRAPLLRKLASVESDLRPTALGSPRASLDLVRMFLAVNRRLLEADSERSLLETILDGAIALSGAERGLVIVIAGKRSGGSSLGLEIRAARPEGRGSRAARALGVSRGIVLRAIETGKPVVVRDAASDPRFRTRASVAERRLSSVVALPLGLGEDPWGALYLDNRSVAGLFTDEAVEVLTGFADQAALALRMFRGRAEMESLARRLSAEVEEGREEIARARARSATAAATDSFHGIAGRSEAMRSVFAVARRAAATDLPVLVSGESGSGKEALSLAIHLESPRAGKPFVTVDCGTLADAVLESELFGHVKGAFTSATSDVPGLFRSADGGTLFLDGVDELSLKAQGKLLRAIESGEVRPVGAEAPVPIDVRFIATTRSGLEARIADGTFRSDLFYRLKGVSIAIPPLREREADIPLLAEEALREAASERGGRARLLAPDALRAILNYPWPGNVRELVNEIRRAALLSDGEELRARDLSRRVASGRPPTRPGAGPRGRGEYDAALRQTERDLLEAVLKDTGGNQSEAARRLGLSRFGLRKKMIRCGLLPGRGPIGPGSRRPS